MSDCARPKEASAVDLPRHTWPVHSEQFCRILKKARCALLHAPGIFNASHPYLAFLTRLRYHSDDVSEACKSNLKEQGIHKSSPDPIGTHVLSIWEPTWVGVILIKVFGTLQIRQEHEALLLS